MSYIHVQYTHIDCSVVFCYVCMYVCMYMNGRQKDEDIFAIGQVLEKLACACIQSYRYVPFESNTYTRMIVCVHTVFAMYIHYQG